MRQTTFFAATAATTVLAAVALVAQGTQEASAPSPEAMARMQPGPMHQKLDPLVGSWTMQGKWRMAPDDPWQEFEADVEREWILDERFVRETVQSEFMGQPFEGIGILGYDNTREEFTMVWVESMSTGTYYSTGRMEGGKLVFEGENSDPWTGEENRWTKSVLEMSGDRHTYRGYCKDESGEEFLSMEMTAAKS